MECKRFCLCCAAPEQELGVGMACRLLVVLHEHVLCYTRSLSRSDPSHWLEHELICAVIRVRASLSRAIGADADGGRTRRARARAASASRCAVASADADAPRRWSLPLRFQQESSCCLQTDKQWDVQCRTQGERRGEIVQETGRPQGMQAENAVGAVSSPRPREWAARAPHLGELNELPADGEWLVMTSIGEGMVVLGVKPGR